MTFATQQALILLLVLAVPFIGAFACYGLGRYSSRLRDFSVSVTSVLTFAIIGFGIPYAIPNLTIRIPIESEHLFYTPVLALTPLSYTVLLISIFVWMCAGLFALGYMPEEQRTNRFYSFWLFTLFATLGVLIAGDFISLYTSFELLTLSTFILINHAKTKESLAAARKYIFLGLFGGFFILAGIGLLYTVTGSIAVAPVYGLSQEMAALISVCMIIGFGVKAGIYPLHVWLPDAHTAAPTPASAILSGVMIKVGAYGIIIASFFILAPTGFFEPLSLFNSKAGILLIWIALITMIFAVFLALMQTNSKRMLAYHSISQMGFIILGIGCGLYLGEAGATGYAGGLYHLVNHALFKALLFLSVGAVFLRTGELNMYRLGGLFRSMPFVGIAMAVGVFAISGVPGFNGFVSKAFIHHALVDAQALGGLLLLPAEAIFIIACGGTVASTGKLLLFTFFGEKKARVSYTGRTPLLVTAGLLGLMIPIILLGLFPGLGMSLILPAAAVFPFSIPGIEYLAGYLGAGGSAVYTSYTLGMAGLEILVGLGIFVAYVIFGWFHWEKQIPSAISPDAWYTRSTGAILRFSHLVGVDLLTRIQQATGSADQYLQKKHSSVSLRHKSKIDYLSTIEGGILLITLVLGMYLVLFTLIPLL